MSTKDHIKAMNFAGEIMQKDRDIKILQLCNQTLDEQNTKMRKELRDLCNEAILLHDIDTVQFKEAARIKKEFSL